MSNTTDVKPYTPEEEKFGRRFIRFVGRLQVWIYRLTGGRLAKTFLGGPVALLTTIGRKTGKPRIVPILFMEQGDNVIVVASQGGMSTHPIWYRNIQKNPHVVIQIGNRKRTMRARHASEQERVDLWPRLTTIYPDFDVYKARCTTREIPVLILEPAG